jgi:hypothetical protein
MVNGYSIRSTCTCCKIGAFLRSAAEESALLVHDATLQVIESRITDSIVKHFQVLLTLERDGIRLRLKAVSFTRKWQSTGLFMIKTTRCTNFTNLFWHETLHVSDSSSVHHQEFIHCTLNNGICHTGL